jgi:hypothetical protein
MRETLDLSPFVLNASRKTAILDTNLLLLSISSRVGSQNLKQFKRVKSFSEQDMLLLAWILEQFKGVATTAYVLAEASNLANEMFGLVRDKWYTELAQFALITHEAHVETQTLGKRIETIEFGVTDSALSYLSDDYTLITSEYRLSGYLQEAGKEVLNFNHLRPLWIFQ